MRCAPGQKDLTPESHAASNNMNQPATIPHNHARHPSKRSAPLPGNKKTGTANKFGLYQWDMLYK
jgi:hypothetical protein